MFVYNTVKTIQNQSNHQTVVAASLTSHHQELNHVMYEVANHSTSCSLR